jgi:hypothetical protein
VKVGDAGAAKPDERARPAPARRFGEALRTATRTARPGLAGAAPAGEELPSAAARTVATRRAAADRSDDALRGRREAFREEARLAPPPPSTTAQAEAQVRAADPLSTPELRALVRTLPLAIQTFGVREGAPLALSFGRSLDVEIRTPPRGAKGVELVLRPEARLARAAESELRGVVAALAAKGIAVARAEVRARGAPPGDARGPRVDLDAGLR